MQNNSADLFAFLFSSSLYPKIYWSGRDENRAIAGIGASSIPNNARKFGWRHFLSTSAPEWRDFAPSYFFQPQHELISNNSSSFLSSDVCGSSIIPPIQKIRYFPSKMEWIRQIENALQAIKRNELEKVVLARRVSIDFDAPIDPISLCQSLSNPHQTLFLIQPTPHSAFLGATPEILYRRKNQQIECDALAGTRLFSQKEELFKSDKEMREFLIVKNRIIEALAPLCLSLPTSSPTTIRSSNQLCHLYSKIIGNLKREITDHELLNVLHPTPAINGFPPKAAHAFLARTESFARGLYAAPIGWRSDHESEFAVGIRSCLIEGSRIHLYAGVGIVEGSNPENEWNESEHKLFQFMNLFNIDS